MAAPNVSTFTARGTSSPRPKGRENIKGNPLLCRNVTIFGSCQKQGCTCSHDVPKNSQQDNTKPTFNVESAAFTPLTATPSNASLQKNNGISPRAANAAIFRPRSVGTATPPTHSKVPSADWSNQGFNEFVPQNYTPSPLADKDEVDPNDGTLHQYNEQFNVNAGTSALSDHSQQSQVNPYTQDAGGVANSSFYQGASTYTQPLNYHLYAPIGPHRENLLAYQRTAHDLFIPDNLREELQRKSEATLQVLPNSTLPQVDHFHTLVPLDTSHQKNASFFGYPSWVYKAVNTKEGNTYTLRRLEGFRLNDQKAMQRVRQEWKRVSNGNIVAVHDSFTTRAFGDSSLIIVTDYHPLSKTLAEQHFVHTQPARYSNSRPAGTPVPEPVLWSYITQIASALKAIHSNGLAARLIAPSKILMTCKNRIRLNACGILDITQYDTQRSLAELQQDDLIQLGRLILCIANINPNAASNAQKSIDYIARSYSPALRDCVAWLLTPAQPTISSSQGETSQITYQDRTIDAFLLTITSQLTATFDASLHEIDSLTSNLVRELENGRLFRLMTKLNMVLERPEPVQSPANTNPGIPTLPPNPSTLDQPSSAWSETGERYCLKLFRDFVFHQVDEQGRPVLDLGHVVACLNKLDAASEERVSLVARNEQDCFVVSYREIKRAVEGAWGELVRAGGGRR
ncbi:PAB-dependent poly(A)-specific ribonuclease subunit 3 [Elasticomyces elasticus]|nr:PAB-dependent poly(A)-specific ribonuclease subunit 3 [Elasticomyces elasticus]